MSFAEQRGFFSAREEIFIHCKNAVLVYDTSSNIWKRKDFSPDFHSRNSNNIIYNPKARCSQFTKKLVLSAVTKQDAEILQYYAGQCLIGKNLTQTILLLTGTPNGGKSTFLSVLQALIGEYNCTELRLEHMGSRFESQRIIGKTLLTGPDVQSNFLMSPSAHKLKSIVGNDLMSTEEKGTNHAVNLKGNFNVVITSNYDLYILNDKDEKAWKRRMLIIKYENPPPEIEISKFDEILMNEESSGILNWAIEGARKLMHNGKKIPRSSEVEQRANIAVMESDPIISFIKVHVKKVKDVTVTGSELLSAFTQYCESQNRELLTERMFQKRLPDAMLKIHGAVKRTDIKRDGKNQRGYYGFQLDSGLGVNPEQAT